MKRFAFQKKSLYEDLNLIICCSFVFLLHIVQLPQMATAKANVFFEKKIPSPLAHLEPLSLRKFQNTLILAFAFSKLYLFSYFRAMCFCYCCCCVSWFNLQPKLLMMTRFKSVYRHFFLKTEALQIFIYLFMNLSIFPVLYLLESVQEIVW